jgi:hypothetical protein
MIALNLAGEGTVSEVSDVTRMKDDARLNGVTRCRLGLDDGTVAVLTMGGR